MTSKYLLGCLLLFCCSCLFLVSCRESSHSEAKSYRVESEKPNWGYIDRTGKTVIKADYLWAEPFENGHAVVTIGKAKGHSRKAIIDREGKFISEFSFDSAVVLSSSLFAVINPINLLTSSNLDSSEQNAHSLDRMHFMDLKGHCFGKPFSNCGKVCGDKLIGETDNSSNVFKNGERKRNYWKNDSSGRCSEPLEMSCELGSLTPFETLFVARRNGKCGYVDIDGNVVIGFNYSQAFNFSEGLARVCINTRSGMRYFFIDHSGKKAFPYEFEYAADFHNGLAGIGRGSFLYGFINKKGLKAFDPPYRLTIFQNFSDGLASFSLLNGGQGFINTSGKVVIVPVIGKSFGDFHDGLCVGTLEQNHIQRSGFIDKTGKWAIKPSFAAAQNFSEDLAPVYFGLN